MIDETEDTADVDYETLIRSVQVLPTQASNSSTTRIADCRAGSSQEPPGTRRSSQSHRISARYRNDIIGTQAGAKIANVQEYWSEATLDTTSSRTLSPNEQDHSAQGSLYAIYLVTDPVNRQQALKSPERDE